MAVGHLDKKWVPDPVQASAGQNSSHVIIPGWVRELTATAIPGGGGSCTVYHTTADEDLVDADPDAQEWVAWDAGSVSVKTSKSTSGPITAIRIAAVGAAAILQLAGQKARQHG